MKNLPLLLASLIAFSACGDKEGDGFEDTSVDTEAEVLDADLDGFDSVESGGTDCDDFDASINPSKFDIVDDGVDNDCDGEVDGFRFNVVSVPGSAGRMQMSFYMSGIPEGAVMMAAVFSPAFDYADWEKDANTEYTIRQDGFLAAERVYDYGGDSTLAASINEDYMYLYPGVEDDIHQFSFLVCSIDQSPIISTGATCVYWGPNSISLISNMKEVTANGGQAVYNRVRNNDIMDTFEMDFAPHWKEVEKLSYTYFAVPPVPESGM